MLQVLGTGRSRPLAALIAFAVTLAVALFAVYAFQTPRDRKAIVSWLRQAPGRAREALSRLLSPASWWSAIRRHRRASAAVGGLLLLAVLVPTLAYRSSARFRLAVHIVRVSERAEGPTHWAPIIREGRPAIPFLISQFTSGQTSEQRTLDRRLDAALRLTLDWLHWRQAFRTDPLPTEPAGRLRWSRWWEENEARVPDLGREDDLYEQWRRLRSGPPALRPSGRPNRSNK